MEIFAGGPRYRNWMTLVSWVMRSVRRSHRKVNFFLGSGIFSGKAESVTLLGFECTVNPQNLINFVEVIFFWENRIFYNFFLCELPLILRVDLTKIMARNICKRFLYIEFERDWRVGLGPALGDGKKFKIYFSSFRYFSGKSRLCHIVGLRIYYKPRKFNQNRSSHFWENKNF